MGAVSRVAVAVSGAATTVFVARFLGQADTGTFALALAVTNVLTVVFTLGVEHGIAYYVSAGRWAPRDAFAVSQRVALVSGVAGATLGLLFRLVVPGPFGNLTVADTAMACFALPLSLSWFYGSYVALADDHYEGFVLPSAIQALSTMVLAVALGIPFGVTGAVVGMLSAHLISAGVTFWFGTKRLSHASSTAATWEPTRTQLDRALRFGVKGYASNALQVLNYRVDVLLLASVAGSAAVGSYAVAVGVTTTLWLLPQALSDVLFPRVASLSTGGEDAEAHRRFVETKTLRHVVLLVLVGGVVLAGASLLLIVPIYGPAFENAIDLSLIRLPGVMLLGVAGVFSSTYVGRGFPVYGLWSALVVTPTTMVLYAVLIPAHGATGAAIASSSSFALSFALGLFFYRRVVGEPVWRRMVPTSAEVRDYLALVPAVTTYLRDKLGRTAG